MKKLIILCRVCFLVFWVTMACPTWANDPVLTVARNTIKDCDVCPDMVVIPAGSFQMGGTRYPWERPLHLVNLKGFALGKTEVTQGQWTAVMGGNNSVICRDNNCPVVNVSWDDAKAYAQKLSEKTGKQYRLPSEAEWEYACRAGQRHIYCGSDSVDAVGWWGANAPPVGNTGNSNNTSHPVAEKQANAFGLYDMSGNVWEWVEDYFHYGYVGAPKDGTPWMTPLTDIDPWKNHHVQRGGSWSFSEDTLRADWRGHEESNFRYFSVGFRIARTLP